MRTAADKNNGGFSFLTTDVYNKASAYIHEQVVVRAGLFFGMLQAKKK